MRLRPQTLDEARAILSRAEARSLEPPDDGEELTAEEEAENERRRVDNLIDAYEERMERNG